MEGVAADLFLLISMNGNGGFIPLELVEGLGFEQWCQNLMRALINAPDGLHALMQYTVACVLRAQQRGFRKGFSTEEWRGLPWGGQRHGTK